MSRPPFVLIDHTADVGFRFHGRTLRELHRNAALCLFGVLGDTGGIDPAPLDTISARGDDRATLLRAWLAELLYISYVRRLVLVDCRVERVTSRSLTARLFGVPYDEALHERNPEVKAITYHGLTVNRARDGWTATVIFDL